MPVGFTWTDPWCGGEPYCGGGQCDETNGLQQLEYCFHEIAVSYFTGNPEYLEFFDETNGFASTGFAYREDPRTDLDQHSSDFVQAQRNRIYLTTGGRYEAFLPSRKTSGSFPGGGFYRFQVYLSRKLNLEEQVASLGFLITNDYFGAAGGYVNGDEALELSNGAVFNNEVMTDRSLIGIVNNDPIRTPSTSDPISTVTGNMYMDETDLTIKGRGLAYVFTRSYNSGPTEVAVDGRPMGHRWSHSYNMRLISNDFGQTPNDDADDGTVSSITYVDERGGEALFGVTGTGPITGWAVTRPRGVFHTLDLSGAGGGSPVYILRFRNGAEYEFGGADLSSPGQVARLQATRDPYGNELTLAYNGNGELSGITDNLGIAGRTGLSFDYYQAAPKAGLLQSITDWTGREWLYAYDDEGNLTSYTNPLGDTTRYRYVPEPAWYVQLAALLFGLWGLSRLRGHRLGRSGAGHAGARALRIRVRGQGKLAIPISGFALLFISALFLVTGARGAETGASRHELTVMIKPEDRDSSGQGDVAVVYAYYRNGKAFRNENSLGHAETVDYDLYRKRTRITDPRGFIRTHYYDADGQLTKLREPDGAILLFDHTDEGLRYLKRDGRGYETSYSYCTAGTLDGCATDTGGNVTREQDALLNSTLYEYGIYDQLTKQTDRRNNEVESSYYEVSDGNGAVKGKLESRFVYLGGVKKTLSTSTYYPDGNLKKRVEFLDPNDQGPSSRQLVTEYFYGAAGLNLERVEISGDDIPSTIVREYTYDDLGRRQTETLYRQTSPTNLALMPLTTTYEYDDLDRITKVIDPRGNYRQTVYDKNGNVKQKIESFGRVISVVSNIYDAADRLVQSENVYGEITTYTYDEAGNLTAVTDPNGHTVHYEYDPMGRRTAVVDANGHRSETRYDLAGNVVATIDANKHTTFFERDPLGRLVSTTDPLGYVAKFGYDANGNLKWVRDANTVAWIAGWRDLGAQPPNALGVTTFNTYDELNRLTSTRDAEDGVTLFEYDLQGNRTKVTDAEGSVTEFVYDALGRLIRVIDPVVETPVDFQETYRYDEAGNLIEKTDRLGRVTEYTYDDLNRLERVDYLADETWEEYVYDAYGNVESVSNPDVTYRYTYDEGHRRTSKRDMRFAAWNRIDYSEFDGAGNLIEKIGYRNDTTSFQYDASNRLVSMTNADSLQVSYHYDPAGNLLNRILSNGTQTDYSYDSANRLTQLVQKTSDGTMVSSLTYQRDRVGNILNETDLAGEDVSFTYDGVYRLLEADYANRSDRAYAYDDVGNRLSETRSSSSTPQFHYWYADSGNRLEIEERTSALSDYFQYTYDPGGNVRTERLEDGTLRQLYDYDQKGQMRSATVWKNGEKIVNSFRYDSFGYRIEKLDSQGTRRYLLEGEHTELVYDDQGRIREQYLRGVVIDEVVNVVLYDERGAPESMTLHHDHLGSVTAVTSHAGDLLATYEYRAFGERLRETGSSDSRLRYTGRELDADTGLYYYRARYYSPRIGRFLSEDPLGFEAGVNFYAYVENNPVNRNDPMGLYERHEELTGAERIVREIADLVSFEVSVGAQAGGNVNVAKVVEVGGTFDLGSGRSGWSNTGWYETMTGGVSVNASIGLPGCDVCTIGVEGSVGKSLDYIPMDPHYLSQEGWDLLLREGTPTSNLAGQLGPWGSISTNDTDIKLGVGAAFIFGASAEVNLTEAWDLYDQGKSYLSGAISDWTNPASGGFVLYPSKPNLNQALPYRK